MASIEFKTFTIDPVQGSDQYSVQVGYVVSGSNFDVVTGQEYREVCHLIGDDTPGDGTDDNLRKLFENTTVFSANTAHFTRAIQLFLPRSALVAAIPTILRWINPQDTAFGPGKEEQNAVAVPNLQ